MALVMLPCDMPWWPTLQRYLTQVSTATCCQELIPFMEKIMNLCNVGLDETEEATDASLPCLERYLSGELNDSERSEFFNCTLPSLASKALDLKKLRPPAGLHFSLQQQSDKVEFERDFFASLLAHAFFSSFPKRTSKTHPTLLDFNFNNFFNYLDSNFQKCKLRSFSHYFNLIEKSKLKQKIIISRQVLTGGEWLTLDDWTSCRLPLCPLYVKRQGSLFEASTDHLRVCSVSSHIGGSVLSTGDTMECRQMVMCPESLAVLLFVEALEDNESFSIEGVLQVSVYSSKDCSLSLLSNPPLVSLCCVDAEDYREQCSDDQYQDDSVLRELNKAFTGFRQGRPISRITMLPRRLSPIGESFSSTPENNAQTSPKSALVFSKEENEARRKFIVLGSSGECLPVNRSTCSPAPSVSPEFFSARSSFTDNDDDVSCRRSVTRLDKEERSSLFAQRLKEALDRAEQADCSMSDFRWGGEGSCGFVLEGGSCEDRPRDRQYLAASSKYSFTTDYGSDLEGWCEELGRWLEEEEAVGGDGGRRQEAVMELAGTLLKRTLSETWAGVPLPGEPPPPPKVHHTPRSLSLELARNRLAAHLMCAVLRNVKQECVDGVKPVATCNWGCGSKGGHPQLKLLLQWMAASVSLLPHIAYYTAANTALNTVDTLCRVVIDRQWSVGELAAAIITYSTRSRRPDQSLFEAIISQEDKPRKYRL